MKIGRPYMEVTNRAFNSPNWRYFLVSDLSSSYNFDCLDGGASREIYFLLWPVVNFRSASSVDPSATTLAFLAEWARWNSSHYTHNFPIQDAIPSAQKQYKFSQMFQTFWVLQASSNLRFQTQTNLKSQLRSSYSTWPLLSSSLAPQAIPAVMLFVACPG